MRQAVYQAIDEQTIVDRIMQGLAIPAGIIVRPGVVGYAPDLDTSLPFDPDRAKTLLAAAGYPDGFAVTLDCRTTVTSTTRPSVGLPLPLLGEIGIRVIVAARPMREHFPMLKHRQTDFYLLSWGSSYFDSLEHFSDLIRSGAPYNAIGYANPHVDGLIDSIRTALVTYARDAMIEEVWKTVRDDIVIVPLHQQVIVWAMRDGLELPLDTGNQPRFRLARLKG